MISKLNWFNKNNEKNKLYILVIITFLLILIKSNFFRSFYEIVFTKYDDRLSKVYGFVLKENWLC